MHANKSQKFLSQTISSAIELLAGQYVPVSARLILHFITGVSLLYVAVLQSIHAAGSDLIYTSSLVSTTFYLCTRERVLESTGPLLESARDSLVVLAFAPPHSISERPRRSFAPTLAAVYAFARTDLCRNTTCSPTRTLGCGRYTRYV